MPNVSTYSVESVDDTALIVRDQHHTATGSIVIGTYHHADATSGAIALTLPLASGIAGRILIITKEDSSTNAVTVTRAGSDTINGSTTFVLTEQYDTVILVTDETTDDVWTVAGYYSASGTGGGSSSVVDLENGNAGSIVIGEPVYSSASGEVNEAKADAVSTSYVIGLVADTTIATAATGSIAVGGVLEATTGQWDTVTGGSGGLTFGDKYFLSAAAAARLTKTAPSTSGDVVFLVGVALSSTKMKLVLREVGEIT